MNFKEIIFVILIGFVIGSLMMLNINLSNIHKELSNLNHKPGIMNIGK